MTTKEKAPKLKALIQKVPKSKDVSVVTHTGPDPDALGAAMGKKLIARHFRRNCKIFYSGQISHPQNLMMVKLLAIEAERIDKFDPKRSGLLALVDVTSPGKKNLQDFNFKPDVIIDHHDDEPDFEVPLCDIRKDVGSSSAIMGDYIRFFNIKLDREDKFHKQVATALRLGIMTDTDNLLHGHDLDHEIISFISPFVDTDLYELLENFSLPYYFYDLAARVQAQIKAQRTEEGSTRLFVGGLGDLPSKRRDVIPQIADLYARHEDVEVVIMVAIIEDNLEGSLRSHDPKLNEKELLASIFGEEHSGVKRGGASGGFRIPLLGFLSPSACNSEKSKALLHDSAVEIIKGKALLFING